MFGCASNHLAQSEEAVQFASANEDDLGVIVDKTIPKTSSSNTANAVGYIEGTYSFPADYIPKDMKIVAHNVETGDEFDIQYKGDAQYKMKVPVGEYFVYAQTAEMEEYRAYYTEFVTCGLSVDCPSHNKIKVEVVAEKTTVNVDAADWYSGE
jgi:hypothetical protein